MQQLTPNTRLQGGKYKIEKVLGQGGFGITYLAYQDMLDRYVCIKEFFFKDYCERDENTCTVTLGTSGSKELVNKYKAKFLKEAKTITHLHHHNIVNILDIFEENGTAYYVMDYIEGNSLADIVKQQGALSENVAVEYIRKIGDALSYIHGQHVTHLDVKPANIMVRKSDNEPLLIDFGLAKQYDAGTGNQTSTTPLGISAGYAPMEQYTGVSEFSPQTDIYSLGATLYKLITGITPPQPTELVENGLNFPANVSPNIAHAITQAMKMSKKERPESVSVFINMLKIQSSGRPSASSDIHTTSDEDESTVLIDKSQNLRKVKDTHAPSAPITEEGNGDIFDDEDESWYKSNVKILFIIAIVAVSIIGYCIYPSKSVSDSTIEPAVDTLAAEPQGKKSEEIENPQINDSKYTGKICDVVEQMPSFPGLMSYLSSHVKYPAVAEENGEQGRVTVQFIVEKDGSVSHVEILHSVSASLDAEALRVVRSMPKWTPGYQDGQAVRVKYFVPVVFRLE